MDPSQFPPRLPRHDTLVRFVAALLMARGVAYFLTLAIIVSVPISAPAQLAAKSAQEWIQTLNSSNRVERMKIDETIAKLQLKPGDVIADIGAGSGLFSLPLAKAASPGGMVYAVDIEQGLLDHISAEAKASHLTNIRTVLGKFSDPNLPSTNIDLALINDVLHHIENRAGYLKSLAHYMKPSGRIVIIDFTPNLGPHKNDPALQVTKDQATSWLAAIGFKPINEIDLFNDKWFVIFSR